LNILVVGHGFDLAHNLPTRYSDFLDFMTLYITKNYPGWQKLGTDPFNDGNNYFKYYNSILWNISRKILPNSSADHFFQAYREKFKDALKNEKLLDNFYENSFLRYCLGVYSYRQSFDKEFNWIDIENELLKFLIELQSQAITKNSLQSLSVKLPYLKNSEGWSTISFFIPTIYLGLKNKNIPPEFFRKEVFDCLFKELENFSLLLKIYLEIVNKDFQQHPNKIFHINTEDESEVTYGISIDRIVSFNYTDTIEIYLPQVPTYFVNGKLKDKNIILGVENPLLKETDCTIDDITLFFKNVQRVLYNFFYEYKKWLTNKMFGINIYIIGHSLASSDKYILADLIMNADTVTIYYYNSKDRKDKIFNLYKILGDQNFSQHVNNDTAIPSIKLVNQSEIYR